MLYWILSLATGGVLAVPGARELSWLHWTPYSSLEFFAVVLPAFLALGFVRFFCRSSRAWERVLEAANIACLLLLFPSPLPLMFSAFWFYALLQWRGRSQRWGPLQGLLLLLPMMLKGNTSELQFVGLSYVTFRAFHLFMDFELLKAMDFRRFFFFVFYFPAIVAGPIDRWPRFRQAVTEAWKIPDVIPAAFSLLAAGLVQKFILGEAIHRYVLPAGLTTATDWIFSFYGYPAYLYLDFAGYSAMAMGFSYLTGVALPRNFDRPYLAVNPQDFWRRFHISLGEWLRDYFFKPIYRASHRWPLVKNSPLARQNLALFLTFLLMGLWNGPRRQYLISGALFGLYSVIHNTYVFWAKRRGAGAPGPLGVWVSRLIMLHAAALAIFIFSGMPFKG